MNKDLKGKLSSMSTEELMEAANMTMDDVKEAGKEMNVLAAQLADNGGEAIALWLEKMARDNKEAVAASVFITTMGRVLGGIIMARLPEDLHDDFIADFTGLLGVSMKHGAELRMKAIGPELAELLKTMRASRAKAN